MLKTRSVSLTSISVIIPVWRDSKALDAQLGILQSCKSGRPNCHSRLAALSPRGLTLRIGGFAPFPLMEDVEFSRRLRRSGKIGLLDPPIRSCAQKQIEQGAWRATLRNLLFLVLFRCGVRAERLHAWYYGLRSTITADRPFAPRSKRRSHSIVDSGGSTARPFIN